MDVGNEMEIFITLTKYYSQQQREEGKPLLGVNYLAYLHNLLGTPPNDRVQRKAFFKMDSGAGS